MSDLSAEWKKLMEVYIMSLFDGFRKKKTEHPKVMQNDFNKERTDVSNDNLDNDESEGYYFENPLELAIYGMLYAKDKNVQWLSGDNYLVEYQKGYQFFEQGRYNKAIETYKKSLELNPIGLRARFEICEAYLALGNLSAARDTLLEMKDYLIEESSIARFYRRMGYIEIEKGNYKVATACYQYSRKFEANPLVAQELMYIMSKAGKGVASKNPEMVLSKAKLPLLTTKSL